MEFAKKQLEKYGWKDGEGLGRQKDGISKPIKPKLKFDKGGLGHDVFDDEISNTWWQRLYDEAAKNIVTKKDSSDSVILETLSDDIEITTKRKKSKKKTKTKKEESQYKNFVKTSELNQNVERKLNEKDEDEEEEDNSKVKRTKISSGICDLTDEELFKICGGRTVHKGARHGLKMNAKLARIEQQENAILNGDNSTPKDKK
ncbi:hypothetical protein RUM44_007616 [Polyplax serrata]|uniref:G patch domain-containing protein 4 n=1 Tax=Polyplax serrata TaxID=468196 RepID=A0ABR1BA42_POLSC